MHPPWPIPQPPAFETATSAQEAEGQSASSKDAEVRRLLPAESQNSGTHAESAAAAQTALPSDDDDFDEDDEQVCVDGI